MQQLVWFGSAFVVLLAVVLLACGGGGGGGGGGGEGPQPGPFPVDADTLALWHLNEGQGQTAYDASPNHYDLQLGPTPGVEGADPNWASGRFGGCLHFVTAENDYATALHSISLPANQASVELWYRALVDGGVLFNAGFINFRLAWGGASPGYIWFGVGDDNDWDDMTLNASWTPVITNGQWHYLAATYDGTTLRVYVDGQERGNAPGGRVLAAPQELHLGGRPSNAFLAGDIDEVRFSRRAREPAEIAEYWAANAP